MDQKIITEKKKQLNNLIGKNKIEAALKEMEDLNMSLDNKSIGNEIIRIRAKKTELDQQIYDEVITNENMKIEKNLILKGLTQLKDRILYIMEHGEEPATPVIMESSSQEMLNKINLIDIIIVILTSLVFLVLLIAFAFALLGKPTNYGLIAFSSAVMIVIILYLKKYKRDMGKGVYQMR